MDRNGEPRMSRPLVKTSCLWSLFTWKIKEFFPGNIRGAKEALGFSSWSDFKWYQAVQGAPLTPEDAYDIEQATIRWAIENKKPQVIIDELIISASSDRHKDPN